MIVQKSVETKLQEALSPVHLEVINESSQHNVPQGSESHFRVVVVSEVFEGQMLIQRHRLINQALAEELKEAIHALAIVAKSPSEWDGNRGQSPDCLGGNKK